MDMFSIRGLAQKFNIVESSASLQELAKHSFDLASVSTMTVTVVLLSPADSHLQLLPFSLALMPVQATLATRVTSGDDDSYTICELERFPLKCLIYPRSPVLVLSCSERGSD